MIQEFNSGVYTYKLVSPALILSKVKINSVDISKYLSNQSKVGWYDVSKNSGRDTTTADGKMILNVISTKYRLDLVTRSLTDDEVIDFFSQIKIKPTMTVEFLNPFDGNWETISAYRGDRNVQASHAVLVNEGSSKALMEMYNPISQALIEL